MAADRLHVVFDDEPHNKKECASGDITGVGSVMSPEAQRCYLRKTNRLLTNLATTRCIVGKIGRGACGTKVFKHGTRDEMQKHNENGAFRDHFLSPGVRQEAGAAVQRGEERDGEARPGREGGAAGGAGLTAPAPDRQAAGRSAADGGRGGGRHHRPRPGDAHTHTHAQTHTHTHTQAHTHTHTHTHRSLSLDLFLSFQMFLTALMSSL